MDLVKAYQAPVGTVLRCVNGTFYLTAARGEGDSRRVGIIAAPGASAYNQWSTSSDSVKGVPVAFLNPITLGFEVESDWGTIKGKNDNEVLAAISSVIGMDIKKIPEDGPLVTHFSYFSEPLNNLILKRVDSDTKYACGSVSFEPRDRAKYGSLESAALSATSMELMKKNSELQDLPFIKVINADVRCSNFESPLDIICISNVNTAFNDIASRLAHILTEEQIQVDKYQQGTLARRLDALL